MARLELETETFEVIEAMAERADAYRVAVALLKLYDWPDSACPEDALRLTLWLFGGDDE
jgi:hypothetical protein